MYAIIETGGKQYRVAEGDTLDVELLPAEPGQVVELDRVLLVASEQGVQVGTPTVEGVTVRARVVETVKGPKVVVFKYKPKNRYRRKTGHRQKYTRLVIDKIVFPGAEEETRTEAEEPEPETAATEVPVAAIESEAPVEEAVTSPEAPTEEAAAESVAAAEEATVEPEAVEATETEVAEEPDQEAAAEEE